MGDLVCQAYNPPEYRTFAAAGLPTAWFHIVATVSADATPEQFRAMLRNLRLTDSISPLTPKRARCRLTGWSSLPEAPK